MDIDFENLVFRRKLKIKISKRDSRDIIETIKRDTEFLRKHGLMDYSILLGIEAVHQRNRVEKVKKLDEIPWTSTGAIDFNKRPLGSSMVPNLKSDRRIGHSRSSIVSRAPKPS